MTVSTDGYALLKTIALPGTVGGHGDYVAYDADTKTMWVAQSPDNNVVVIDTTTNTVKATIPNIGNANGVAFSPQYAFVADVTDNTTDVIDKRSFQVVAKVAQTGTTPDGVIYIPGTNQVAVASDDDNVLDFLNATGAFAQTASVQLLPNPAVSGPDVPTYVPQKDLIYQPDDMQVDLINPHTDAIVGTWNLLSKGSVKPLVYDPVTNHFLVGTTNNQALVVDGDSGKILQTIALPGSVDEVTIDVSAGLAFFGDKAGAADVVNLDTNQLVGELPAEKNMHTLAVDPTTHDVYVYENNRNTVDVYQQSSATGGGTALTMLDTTTGQRQAVAGDAYSGPVAGLQRQYIYTGSDSLNVATDVPNMFVHTGPGFDAIDVSAVGGTNVLDGGTGSNFLVGGTGPGSQDTFFVDDRGPAADIWSTVANFHQGDAATVFGITAQDYALQWVDNQGAAGYTGLTLHATAPGKPTASLTLSGYSTADLSNGRLTTSFGTVDGSNYLYIKGTG